jgi:hypothetical protein
MTIEDLQLEFPLHCAIVNDKTPNIAAKIQSFYDKDPASIHKTDDMGFTPIFVAVSSQNLAATRKLLEWDIRADLENSVNVEGVTPLERLADTMRSVREFAETFGLEWEGYSNDELTMQRLLQQAMGQSVDTNIVSREKSESRCTCNQDLEFQLVRSMIGLDGRRGPYDDDVSDGDGVDMVDSDEDEDSDKDDDDEAILS